MLSNYQEHSYAIYVYIQHNMHNITKVNYAKYKKLKLHTRCTTEQHM